MLSSAIRRTPITFRRHFPHSPTLNLLLKPTSIARPSSTVLRSQFIVRGAASSVSGRPGSQTLGHAAQNIREEVGSSAADLAKSIAGGNLYVDNVEPTQQTFVCISISSCREPRANHRRRSQLGITNAVAHSVPTPYVVFGLAGGLPYLGASGATIYLAHQAGIAAQGS